jgi:hypothetical protein
MRLDDLFAAGIGTWLSPAVRCGIPSGDIVLLPHASLWYQEVGFCPAASCIHQHVLNDGSHMTAMNIHRMFNCAQAAIELAPSA